MFHFSDRNCVGKVRCRKNEIHPPEIALSKDFAPFIKWVYKKISRKKSLSPPWITQGGDILAVPPLNCSGGGQFSGGGQSPPWNCSGGGQSPIPPPCIRSCIHILSYKCNLQFIFWCMYASEKTINTMMKLYTLYHYQIYTYLYMDIICNQSFSLLEIYYRYGYKLRD